MSVGDRVELQCALFRLLSGGYFRMATQTHEPVYIVSHDGVAFALPFRGIRKEFGIAEGSHDDLMLQKVAEALSFVHALRPGDRFPAEMIDRRASWRPAEQDKRYASALLQSGLVSWHRGGDLPGHCGPQELVARMEQVDMRQAVEAAVLAVAQEPKSGIPDAKIVWQRMLELAEEISYCEYIFRKSREGFTLVEERLKGFSVIYKRDRIVSDQISRCLFLLEKAKEHIGNAHAETAANYGESYPAIVNFNNMIPYLREARDRHYKSYRVCEELFLQWSRVSVVEDRTVLSVIENTYRMLAQRYAPIEEWVAFLTNPTTRKPKIDIIDLISR